MLFAFSNNKLLIVFFKYLWKFEFLSIIKNCDKNASILGLDLFSRNKLFIV